MVYNAPSFGASDESDIKLIQWVVQLTWNNDMGFMGDVDHHSEFSYSTFNWIDKILRPWEEANLC